MNHLHSSPMRVHPATGEGIIEAVEVLKNGGVVVHATETCYGIACDLSNPEAVQKLFAIKQRPEHQPVSALFSSIDEAKKYVEWNEKAEELAAKHLPGPLTLILPLKKNMSIFPNPNPNPNPNPSPTLGIRISSHPVAHTLVEKFGAPLSTTSANIHGQRNPYDLQTIIAQFESSAVQPDLILDSGTIPEMPPSTVIDLTGEEMQELRKGTV